MNKFVEKWFANGAMQWYWNLFQQYAFKIKSQIETLAALSKNVLQPSPAWAVWPTSVSDVNVNFQNS